MFLRYDTSKRATDCQRLRLKKIPQRNPLCSCVFQIEVIEEAIKYIAYLQATLSSRFEENNESKFETEELPELQRSELGAHFKLEYFFFSLTDNGGERTVERTESERRPKVLRQKRQRLASYMIKTQRHTLPARRKFSSKSAEICVFLSTV